MGPDPSMNPTPDILQVFADLEAYSLTLDPDSQVYWKHHTQRYKQFISR
jgi:hypothetical protein